MWIVERSWAHKFKGDVAGAWYTRFSQMPALYGARVELEFILTASSTALLGAIIYHVGNLRSPRSKCMIYENAAYRLDRDDVVTAASQSPSTNFFYIQRFI